MALQFLVSNVGTLEDLFNVPLAQRGTLVNFTPTLAAGGAFDLYVIDCGSLSAAAFEQAATAASAALQKNKPVLVLRPTTAAKVALAGAGALRTYVSSDSLALLIEPQRDGNNYLRFALAEQYSQQGIATTMVRYLAQVLPSGQTQVGPSDTLTLAPSGDPSSLDLQPFVDRVTASVTALQSGQIDWNLSLSGSASAVNQPPTNIPSGLYDVTPIVLYVPLGITSTGNAGNYSPPTGTFLWFSATATIGVYYDNVSYSKPVQWLFIDISGQYYTAGLEVNTSTAIGWSLTEMQIAGTDINSGTISSNYSSPNNVNGETSYTTGADFTVGLSAGTDGLSGNTSYTVSESQSNTISDWGVTQTTPNSWTFAQQVPYAFSPGTYPDGAFQKNGNVSALPTISTGSLTFDAQTIWIQTPAIDGPNLQIPYGFTLYTGFAYSSGGKNWEGTYWQTHWNLSWTFNIAWSSAWPSSGS